MLGTHRLGAPPQTRWMHRLRFEGTHWLPRSAGRSISWQSTLPGAGQGVSVALVGAFAAGGVQNVATTLTARAIETRLAAIRPSGLSQRRRPQNMIARPAVSSMIPRASISADLICWMIGTSAKAVAAKTKRACRRARPYPYKRMLQIVQAKACDGQAAYGMLAKRRILLAGR